MAAREEAGGRGELFLLLRLVLGVFSVGEPTPADLGGARSGVWSGWLAVAGSGDASVGWKRGGAVEEVLGSCAFIESSCRRGAAAGLCDHLRHGAALLPRRIVVRRRRRRLSVLGVLEDLIAFFPGYSGSFVLFAGVRL